MENKEPEKVKQEKEPETLKDWLKENGLGEHYNSFTAEGATKVSDLVDLTDADIEKVVDKWELGLIN